MQVKQRSQVQLTALGARKPVSKKEASFGAEKDGAWSRLML